MNWTEILNAGLHAVIIAAVPWLLAQVKPLISAAFDWIEAKTSSTWARALEAEAEQIVLDLWENASKIVKAKLADGRMTADEARDALSEIGVLARARLMAWVSKLPERFRPQIETKVGAALEAALARLKIVKSVPPATVPTSGGPSTAPAGSPSR